MLLLKVKNNHHTISLKMSVAMCLQTLRIFQICLMIFFLNIVPELASKLIYILLVENITIILRMLTQVACT